MRTRQFKNESGNRGKINVTIAHQTLLSMEFSRQEYWNGLLFPSPEDLPYSGIEPGSPALQADSLLSELPGKQCIYVNPNLLIHTPLASTCSFSISVSLSLLANKAICLTG